MRRRELGQAMVLALAVMALSAGAQAQSVARSGVVSGSITIDGKPAADAVVSVEKIAAEQKPRAPYYRKATMAQRDLRFYPYVLPILAGTNVDFLNDDRMWHNVFSASETKKFDLGLYGPGKSRSVTFDTPGVVRIQCNVHPTMEAFIVVEDNSYFSATDRDGNYRIAVPLGTHRLTVWHPTMGARSEPFTVEHPDEVLRLDIDLGKTK